MDRLLELLEENARLTDAQLAAMLDRPEEEISRQIRQYEKDGVIKGYRAVVDHQKTEEEEVFAIIELKVTPKRDYGFEEIAKKIAEYPEVESVYLMSGGYDLAVFVSGKDLKEIAMFVAKRLSLLDSVISTATHFLLTRYKDQGLIMGEEKKDERSVSFL